MRAKSKIYHIKCFKCCACSRPLVPGDEFALRDGGNLYCKEDHDHMEKTSAPTTPHLPSAESNNNTSLSNNNHSSNSTELGCMSGMHTFTSDRCTRAGRKVTACMDGMSRIFDMCRMNRRKMSTGSGRSLLYRFFNEIISRYRYFEMDKIEDRRIINVNR
jgi:hypothetical protein